MHASLKAVLARTKLAKDLDYDDHALSQRLAGELTRYGVGALPKEFFDGPSGRNLARIACEDIEGVRRMRACFAERETAIEVTEEIEVPAAEEDGEPVKKTVTRQELRKTPPRVLELSEGRGMISLILGLTWPEYHFVVADDDNRRRWLWRRMLASLGLRNIVLLPAHSRIAPGEWDVVLVKDVAPPQAMDLAGSLLAAGGNMLLWQDRHHAKGLRRRHLDARSRPLHLAAAVALESPAARGRLVARVSSAAEILDSKGPEA